MKEVGSILGIDSRSRGCFRLTLWLVEYSSQGGLEIKIQLGIALRYEYAEHTQLYLLDKHVVQ